jgi:hypothetical protein
LNHHTGQGLKVATKDIQEEEAEAEGDNISKNNNVGCQIFGSLFF